MDMTGASGQQPPSFRDIPALLWMSEGPLQRYLFTDEWLAFTGHSPDEVVAQGWIGDIHSDDVAAYRARAEAAAQAEQGWTHEYRLRRNDGMYRQVLENAEPRRDHNGVLLGYTGTCIDVTDRRSPWDVAVSGDAQRQTEDLLANIPGVVWEARGRIGTPEFQVTYVSQQVERLLGYSVERAAAADGQAILRIMHPDDRQRVLDAAALTYDDGEPRSERFRWLARDGHAVWMQGYFRPVRDEGGKVIGLRGVNLDISEQRRADDLLEFAIGSSRILFSSLDYQSTLENVARLAVPKIADWCSIHLLKDGELKQVSVAHVNPDKVARVRELQEAHGGVDVVGEQGPLGVVRSGQSVLAPEVSARNLEAVTTDPEIRKALQSLGMRSYMCVPITRLDQVMGAISLVAAESGRRFDDVDLRAAESLGRRAGYAIENALLYEEAQRERARFASIVQSVDYAVCRIDTDGCIEHLNPAAEAILGRPVEAWGDALFHDIVHPVGPGGEPCDPEVCPVLRVMVKAVAARGDDVFRVANGHSLNVRVNCSPIEVNGVALGAVIVFEDVTERLEVEQRKDDFLTFATHELRNPLTPILGLSRWFERHVRENPGRYETEVEEVAETLAAESERMVNIVDVFLDLSRIESNRLVVDPLPVDLCELVTSVAGTVEKRHPHTRLEVKLIPSECRIVSDEARLRQVLANLLDNAAKYGGDEPQVFIRLEDGQDFARIQVRDLGPGIPEEEQQRVFERFYRSASSSTGKKGFGVGLFLTREIVRQLGGDISLVSKPGEGTEFTVTVPHRIPMVED